MAIEKNIEQDKIEVVGQYKAINVREATIITEDGAEISRSFRRYVLDSDATISSETAEVQAVCNAVWTDEVKAAWAAHQARQRA